MKRIAAIGSAVVTILIVVTSCSLTGGIRSDQLASAAAGAVLDYVASVGYEQVQELDTAAETYDLEPNAQAMNVRAVSEESFTRSYPGVTIEVTRTVDDNGTASPTDDVVTVTRVFDYDFEADRIQVLTRPRRPTTDPAWDSYFYPPGAEAPIGWQEDPIDSIAQSGTISNSLDAVLMSSGTIGAVWKREGDAIFAETIVREMSNVVRPEVVHRTTLTQTADGETTLTHERLVDGEVVHTYTVDTWEDPDTGQSYTRITREDGSYAIVRERGDRLGDPRVVDYFTADDVLVMTVEEIFVASSGTIVSTRTYYDADGNVTGEQTVTWLVNYMEGDEDSVQITRTVDGRTRQVTITESGEVYIVVIRGEEYRIRVTDVNSVQFLDDAGNVIMTATRLPDGSWAIERSDDLTPS